MAQKITLKVVKKVQVTKKVYFVTFRLVSPPTITYKAGQNMMLMIPPSSAPSDAKATAGEKATAGKPGVNRTMSIASPPSNDHELLMIHDVTPMGPGSKWTVSLSEGDSATIVAPTGGALMFMDTDRRKVMVATGTGVAPFHAMILDKLSVISRSPRSSSGEAGQSSDQKSLKAEDRPLMALYWGQRFEDDVYWKEEFDMIAAAHPNFTWHQILSRPTPAWQGLRGHVTEHVLEQEKDMVNSEFYLCGNKAMIEEVRSKLIERNVPKEQIKTELFY